MSDMLASIVRRRKVSPPAAAIVRNQRPQLAEPRAGRAGPSRVRPEPLATRRAARRSTHAKRASGPRLLPLAHRGGAFEQHSTRAARGSSPAAALADPIAAESDRRASPAAAGVSKYRPGPSALATRNPSEPFSTV
jgi:hypothetical protein